MTTLLHDGTRPTGCARQLTYRDAGSGLRVVVRAPQDDPAAWWDYLTGAVRSYRRHGVSAVLDLDAVADGATTALFFTVLDDDDRVLGGMRAQGPYRDADESHAVLEWAGDAGQDEVRARVAARLADGVVEGKTGWVAEGAPHRRALAGCLARGPVHAAALLGSRWVLGTSAEHTLAMWASTGAVVEPGIGPVPYPDERYRTRLLFWDRWAAWPQVGPEQRRALRTEHRELVRSVSTTRPEQRPVAVAA
ncbi:hypothetical protein GCM10027047_34640 [Rhodococcus aerolatus]